MTTRLASLAAYTVLPLVGVLLLGWDWREIVLLYWLENVSLGIAMLVKLIRSADAPGGHDPEVVGTLTVNGNRVTGPVSGLILAGFFALHYGIFTLVHGVFVLLLISGMFLPGGTPDGPMNGGGALLVWVIAGAIQVMAAIIGPLPARRGSALMFSAYPRIIVLHVSVILGIFAISALDWDAAAALLLIALHGLVDGAGWMLSAARDRRASSTVASPPPA
ncbi:hypothetical protein GCM10009792_08710 [Microcella alkalica]|uniref:Uncharacterized protein n=1 Tax=Microcella alkalica TaxID=355930 RepID=A0A839E1P6_9MICO|nr:DUF6498-containing protein [Microcella alkalica]MBA8846609.1 hypothetical protein [Microcella alkalica]